MGCRLSSAALIEQYDSVFIGIKKASIGRACAATGPTVDEEYRYSLGVSRFLHMEYMRWSHSNLMSLVGADCGKSFLHVNLARKMKLNSKRVDYP